MTEWDGRAPKVDVIGMQRRINIVRIAVRDWVSEA